jgi:hypothetical protein
LIRRVYQRNPVRRVRKDAWAHSLIPARAVNHCVKII